MRRRVFIGAIAAVALLPRAKGADQKAYTLGLLWLEAEKPSKYSPSLLADLQERGYVSGRNLRVLDSIVGTYEALPEAAKKLVAEKPDVIVTYGSTATQAAHSATSTIAIVSASVLDTLGFTKSLAHPGGNITGIALVNIDLVGKRLEILKAAAPRMRHVTVLFYEQSEGEHLQVVQAEKAAAKLGLDVKAIGLRTADEISSAIRQLRKRDVDGLLVAGSSMLRSNRAHVVALVAESKLPAVYSDTTFAEAGGLLSYGHDLARNFQRMGAYVDKIFKGTPPGDLPIEQFSAELVVNLRTAKKQGITIPPAVLVRANRIIE